MQRRSGRHPHVKAVARALGARDPVIDLQFSASGGYRRTMRDALLSVLKAEAGGPWRVRISGALIYGTPDRGDWWWRVALTSGTGETRTFLVDSKHHLPEFLSALVGAVARGEPVAVVCSVCQRARREDGSWHDQPNPGEHAPASHDICPACAGKLQQANPIPPHKH